MFHDFIYLRKILLLFCFIFFICIFFFFWRAIIKGSSFVHFSLLLSALASIQRMDTEESSRYGSSNNKISVVDGFHSDFVVPLLCPVRITNHFQVILLWIEFWNGWVVYAMKVTYLWMVMNFNFFQFIAFHAGISEEDDFVVNGRLCVFFNCISAAEICGWVLSMNCSWTKELLNMCQIIYIILWFLAPYLDKVIYKPNKWLNFLVKKNINVCIYIFLCFLFSYSAIWTAICDSSCGRLRPSQASPLYAHDIQILRYLEIFWPWPLPFYAKVCPLLFTPNFLFILILSITKMWLF